MPYIKLEERAPLLLDERSPANPGELNYLFTVLATEYFTLNGENYQAINDVIGALEGCKLEFYRRIAVDYENRKMKENGDVY